MGNIVLELGVELLFFNIYGNTIRIMMRGKVVDSRKVHLDRSNSRRLSIHTNTDIVESLL